MKNAIYTKKMVSICLKRSCEHQVPWRSGPGRQVPYDFCNACNMGLSFARCRHFHLSRRYFVHQSLDVYLKSIPRGARRVDRRSIGPVAVTFSPNDINIITNVPRCCFSFNQFKAFIEQKCVHSNGISTLPSTSRVLSSTPRQVQAGGARDICASIVSYEQ